MSIALRSLANLCRALVGGMLVFIALGSIAVGCLAVGSVDAFAQAAAVPDPNPGVEPKFEDYINPNVEVGTKGIDEFELTAPPKTSAAGTLVAAAMETAGYKMQSIVLSELGRMLESLAALVFIACAMFAMGYFVIFNKYDHALWFLVGPAMFYWLVFATRQSAGAEWQMGTSKIAGSTEAVNAAIGGKVNARVSWFFDEWNHVVSEAVTDLVAIFTEADKKPEETIRRRLAFTLRQQAMDAMTDARVTDGGLRNLIDYGFRGLCSEALEAARYVAQVRRDKLLAGTPEFRNAMTIYAREFTEPRWWTALQAQTSMAGNGGQSEGANAGSTEPDPLAPEDNGRKLYSIADPVTRDYLVVLLTAVRDKVLKVAQSESAVLKDVTKLKGFNGKRHGIIIIREAEYSDDVDPRHSKFKPAVKEEVDIVNYNMQTGEVTFIDANGQTRVGNYRIEKFLDDPTPDNFKPRYAVIMVDGSIWQDGKGALVANSAGMGTSVPVRVLVTSFYGPGRYFTVKSDNGLVATGNFPIVRWLEEEGSTPQDENDTSKPLLPDTIATTDVQQEWRQAASKVGLNCLARTDLVDPEKTVVQPVSCQQLWCWTGWGVRLAAEGAKLKIDNQLLAGAGITDQKLIERMWQEISLKMQPLPEETKIKLTYKVNGKDVLKDGSDASRENAAKLIEQTFPELGAKRIEPDVSIIPTVIGGMMLKAALLEKTDQGVMKTLARHSGWEYTDGDFYGAQSGERILGAISRMQAAGLAQQKRYEIFSFAMSLPYLQGALLYFLALLFPFFGIFLIIPEKFNCFFSFLALWAWVKSWDVGWAMAMVLEETLWTLMPHTSAYDPLVDPRNAPITILDSAFQGDPAYSSAMYYSIMGLVLVAVPLISGQVVLGARGAIGALLVTGLQSLGQPLGKAASDWSLHNNMARIDMDRIKGLDAHVINNFDSPANASLAKMKAEADAGFESGGLWGAAGQVGGAAMVVGGAIVMVATGWTGVGIAAGAGLMSGGTALWHSGGKYAQTTQRGANKLRAQYREANYAFHLYNGGKQDAYRNMDAVRAALSGRGEFWTMPESPTSELAMLKQAPDEFRATQTGANWGYGVAAGLSIASAALPFLKFGGGPAGSAIGSAATNEAAKQVGFKAIAMGVGKSVLTSAATTTAYSMAGGIISGWVTEGVMWAGQHSSAFVEKQIGMPVNDFIKDPEAALRTIREQQKQADEQAKEKAGR